MPSGQILRTVIGRAMYCEAPVNGEFVQVGVVGLGYWGPNLARNFDALPGCKLSWCCDGQPAARGNDSRPCFVARGSPSGSKTCWSVRVSMPW